MRKICVSLTMKKALLLFLFFPSILFSQTWQVKTPVPAAGRDDGVAFSILGLGYVVTGNQGGFAESNKLFSYDPSTNQWTEKTPFPGQERQYAGAFVLHDKAYVFCGYSSTNQALKDVWQYNPSNDSWLQMNDFPGLPRWTFFQFATQEYGFIGAGAVPDSSLADCWKYDPQNDQWQPIADYPGGRIREVVGFTIGENCFAGSGLNINPLTFSKSFYEYRWKTDEWIAIADFPGGYRSYMGAQGAGLSAIVGGGWGNANTFYTDFYELKLDGTWTSSTSAPIQGWRGMATFSIGGTVYFLCGLYANLTRTSDVYALNLESDYFPMLYPNPSGEQARVYYAPNAAVQVYDFSGQLVHEGQTDANGNYFLPKLSAALYTIHLQVAGKNVKQLKWMVR